MIRQCAEVGAIEGAHTLDRYGETFQEYKYIRPILSLRGCRELQVLFTEALMSSMGVQVEQVLHTTETRMFFNTHLKAKFLANRVASSSFSLKYARVRLVVPRRESKSAR